MRWPPWASTMPSTLSSESSARGTRRTPPGWPEAPAWGCTFAWSAPNSCLRTVDRELLGDVDELAPAVVAPPGVALGVLVVHRRADRGQHGRARVVLRRDEAQVRPLALQLVRRSPRRPPGRWPSRPPSRPRTPCIVITSSPRSIVGDLLQSRGTCRPPSNSVVEPHADDLPRVGGGDDPAAHAQDVRVVVLARQLGEEQVVAERRADAVHLVRGDLLALARAADARSRGRLARRRPRARAAAARTPGSPPGSVRIGAVVDHLVALLPQERLQVLLEGEAGVIGSPSRSASLTPRRWPRARRPDRTARRRSRPIHSSSSHAIAR